MPWSALFGSLFVLLTCIGIVGNVIVILAIGGDKKLRKSVMNILLLNLVGSLMRTPFVFAQGSKSFSRLSLEH